MSTAASESRNWSTCLESEASHSKVCEPPAPVDEELLRILTEVVQDLGLDWSPIEQPTRNRMDMWFPQSGRHAATPQRPTLFFPEVHDEISRSSPKSEPRDCVCPPLSTEPTTWGILSRRPSRRPLQPIYV